MTELEKMGSSEQQQQRILEKFDSESRCRVFKNKKLNLIIITFSLVFSLYHLYTSYFGAPPDLKHRSLHVAGALILIFLLYPAHKKSKSLTWYDVLMAIGALSTSLYILVYYSDIINRGGI